MNDLSLLIYLADVCGSSNSLLTFMSGIFGSIFALLCLITMAAGDTLFGDSSDEAKEVRRGFGRAYKAAIWGFVIATTLNVCIPAKETVYAIAASEVGEQVIESPTAKKAVDALNRWLDQQAK